MISFRTLLATLCLAASSFAVAGQTASRYEASYERFDSYMGSNYYFEHEQKREIRTRYSDRSNTCLKGFSRNSQVWVDERDASDDLRIISVYSDRSYRSEKRVASYYYHKTEKRVVRRHYHSSYVYESTTVEYTETRYRDRDWNRYDAEAALAAVAVFTTFDGFYKAIWGKTEAEREAGWSQASSGLLSASLVGLSVWAEIEDEKKEQKREERRRHRDID